MARKGGATVTVINVNTEDEWEDLNRREVCKTDVNSYQTLRIQYLAGHIPIKKIF